MRQKRGNEMKALLKRVMSLVTDEMLKSFGADRQQWEESIEGIRPSDSLVEFCPFVLSAYRGGWELADGDPVCNWCCNTFSEKFPKSVNPQLIVNRMTQSLGEGLIVTDEQFRKYLPGHIEEAVSATARRM